MEANASVTKSVSCRERLAQKTFPIFSKCLMPIHEARAYPMVVQLLQSYQNVGRPNSPPHACLRSVRSRRREVQRNHFGISESALLEEASRGCTQVFRHHGNPQKTLRGGVTTHGLEQPRTDALIAASGIDYQIVEHCNQAPFRGAHRGDESCHGKNSSLFTHHEDAAKLRLLQRGLHTIDECR